jgi:hypothetical protein
MSSARLPAALVAFAVLAAALAGCARAGFELGLDESSRPGRTDLGEALAVSRSDGASGLRLDGASELRLDQQHDTCGSPLALTLTGPELQIVVDTTAASADLALPCCGSSPDLVVVLTGAPANLRLSCEGGGALPVAVRGSCAGPGTTICASLSCVSPNEMTVPAPSATSYLVVCRRASEGPAVLRLAAP